jgi:C_GCAxxG_C_C family probable redox protein
MMSRVEQAISCFKEGFTCSQAILSTFCESLGLEKEIALKVAQAFGGGIARMGKTCGAVTGAFMVIGLKFGRIKIDDNEGKEKTYSLVEEFVRRFTAMNGTIVCNELLGYDISTPEGLKQAGENQLFDRLCPRLVQNSAEILEEILQSK